MSTIMPAFDTFPKEGSIVGRLLAGYGELELGLCFCVAAVRDDFDMVFKAMFRPRGESQRIAIGDAMGREPFQRLKLGRRFEEAVASTRYCLKIRNQYAHCYWTDDFGRQLGFVELEDTAKSNQPVNNVFQIKAHDLTLALLQKQEAYFVYTRRYLTSLEHCARAGAAPTPSHPLTFPQKVKRPILCSP